MIDHIDMSTRTHFWQHKKIEIRVSSWAIPSRAELISWYMKSVRKGAGEWRRSYNIYENARGTFMRKVLGATSGGENIYRACFRTTGSILRKILRDTRVLLTNLGPCKMQRTSWKEEPSTPFICATCSKERKRSLRTFWVEFLILVVVASF